ncbi:hypothetical protein COOONC_19430, partial [Cooperia oncophora]
LGPVIDNYDVFRCDRPKKCGGGVILFGQRRLSISLILAESVVDSFEVLCADVMCRGCNLRIIVLYRAPSCNKENSELLFRILSDLVSCERHSIILGDFNLPEFCQESEALSRSSLVSCLKELIQCHNLEQHVNEATRGIAYLIYAPFLIKGLTVVSPVGVSDHNSISFNLMFQLPCPSYTYRRMYSRCNFSELNRSLAQIHWVPCSNLETISLFLGRGSLVSNPSIFPNTCKICGNTVNVCSMKLRRLKKWDNTIAFTKKFFTHLKKYNIYLEKKIIESGNVRCFYRYLSKRIQDIQRIGCLRKGNIIATSPMDKANLLAEHFESVFQEDDGRLPDFVFPNVEPMQDFPWFSASALYELIM